MDLVTFTAGFITGAVAILLAVAGGLAWAIITTDKEERHRHHGP